jgi:hypothetical protein
MLRTMQPFNSDLDADYLGWINRLHASTGIGISIT